MSVAHSGLAGCLCPLCAPNTPDGTGDAAAPVSDGPAAIIADGKPLLTPEQAAAVLARDAGPWGGGTVTFAFRTAAPDAAYGEEGSAFTPFNAAQLIAARLAVGLWDDVLAISFREAPEDGAQILMGNTSYRNFQAYAQHPGEAKGGDIWVNPTKSSNQQLVNGQYGLYTLIHELGHAIGLSHAGDYDAGSGAGGTSYAGEALYRQDTQQYTAMSYFGALATLTYHGMPPRYAATPLLHDILAAQALYGPDLATRGGDTVYGYGSTAGRSAFDFNRTKQPVVAIWDAGGVDTLDLSGGTAAAVVTLAQGGLSDVNGFKGNVAVAFGTQLENAVGTAFADRIAGNELPNLLQGGAGDDTLEGGAGVDTARFLGDRAGYRVTSGPEGTTVADLDGGEGTDLLTGIERLAFADGVVDLVPVPAVPTVQLSSLRVSEGSEHHATLLFQLVLSQPATAPVSVRYATVAGSAAEGRDFAAASGTVTLEAGASAALIPVRLLMDQAGEGEESFSLVLSDPVGAVFAGGPTLAATATILDDDPLGPDAVPDTAAGAVPLEVGRTVRGALERAGDRDWYRVELKAGRTYVVDLQGRAAAAGSLEDPWVAVLDGAGREVGASDDDGIGRNGRVTVTPTSDGVYTIEAKGWDDGYGGTYALAVTEGVALPPTLSVADATAREGAAGGLVFTLTLSAPSAGPVTVFARTEDGTAAAGRDYGAVGELVRFEPGRTTATVAVPVLADRAAEGTESLTLRLSTPEGAVLAGGALTLAAAGAVVDGGASGGAAAKPSLLLARPGGDVLSWRPDLGGEGFSVAGGFDPATVAVAGSADLTGDGALDLLLDLGGGRFVAYEVGRGAAGFVELPALGAFRPLFAGDLQGSAAADLLTVDAATGAVEMLDVAAGTARHLLTMAQGFSAVAVADIDGAGRDDVVFLNGADGALFYWNGGGFADLLSLSPGWRVAAAGDFLGGEEEDLLFHDVQTGTLLFWEARLGASGFTDFVTLSPGWRFLAAGDVDADGRDDVILREEATGHAIRWTGGGFADFGGVLADVALVGIGPVL
ncbi:MAG TPA: M10 family metallopeptidase C-terminal domain-containing protein [Azospirillaceae bacterium]|nr:M10 family metallopeptidase C-terminal domain-containing protein [Azospirillaceae bacterium]